MHFLSSDASVRHRPSALERTSGPRGEASLCTFASTFPHSGPKWEFFGAFYV